MRKIPEELRNELAGKKYYKNCALCFKEGVQWHHNLIYGGKQVNAEFCIIPLCPNCHEKANEKSIKEKLNWIMLNRATDEEIELYSKAIPYRQVKTNLNNKYGKYVWHLNC